MTIVPGVVLAILAGAMQGIFPLPMKYTAKWNWENTWAAFSLWGFVVLPWLIAFLTVPNLPHIYASASGSAIVAMTLFGAGWGCGTICYGIGINRVGLALSTAIVIGITGSLGTLIPMIVFHPGAFYTRGGITIAGGVAMMLLGVGICALAGCRRESLSDAASSDPRRRGLNRSFLGGLLVCIVAGIASSMLNFAFVFSEELVATAKAAGASPVAASNCIWCWVMTSAFVVTAAYCAFQMRRNRSWRRYADRGTGYYWALTFLMGFLWSTSIAVYGIALSQLGRLAASIGWSAVMVGSVITANVAGMATGEWKSADRASLGIMILGLATLAAAIIVIGAGNS
jgi:L-rhamnose-H+ transport protein